MQKSILLVDDDDNIRENYTDILQEEGYRVVGCDRSGQAVAMLEKDSFDLVILDISMHGDRMAGHNVCKEIKTRHPQVSVIMLTSLENEKNRQIAEANGSDGYLIKSGDIREFVETVAARTA